MSQAEFDISLSLIIRTKESFECISNIMGFEPTKKIGLQPKTIESIDVDENIWVYKERYENCIDIGLVIQKFTNGIKDFANKVFFIKEYGTCVIRLSIVSIYGQFGFSLSEKDLFLLSNLQIPLEMTFFSYGSCIDE